MRRLFIIFLLLVVPFQLSWGAAAAYCQHETAPKTFHFGHHSHHHADTDTKPVKLKQNVVDNDCATCHLGGIGLLAADAYKIPVVAAKTKLQSLIVPLFSSLRPDRPERPKWARAVL